MLFFIAPGFSQSGTIKVQRETSMEIFGLQSNRTGSPQSYILLVDGSKAVFINTYAEAKRVHDNYQNGHKVEGRVLPGMYKMEDHQIFIYLMKGVKFIGNRIDDALYLKDHTGEQVIFFKIFI